MSEGVPNGGFDYHEEADKIEQRAKGRMIKVFDLIEKIFKTRAYESGPFYDSLKLVELKQENNKEDTLNQNEKLALAFELKLREIQEESHREMEKLNKQLDAGPETLAELEEEIIRKELSEI